MSTFSGSRFIKLDLRWGGWPLAWAVAAVLSAWLTVMRHSVLGGGLALISVAAGWLSLRRNQSAVVQPRRSWRWKRFLGFLLTLVATIVSSISYGVANQMVHPARMALACDPAAQGLADYQTVAFPAADGLTLRGWYVLTKNGATVILLHGLNRNRCRMLGEAMLLSQAGYGVLFYDARNAGESEGTVTTFGVQEVRDVVGAVDFLSAQPEIDVTRIGLFGHSLGGATAIMAAAQLPAIRAVIAESTFTSMDETVATNVYRTTHLPVFPFTPLIMLFGGLTASADLTQARPIDALAELGDRPVMIAHGDEDGLLPVANAYRLYEAVRGPKELFIAPHTSHYCCLPAGTVDPGYLSEYRARFIGFLDKYLLPEQ